VRRKRLGHQCHDGETMWIGGQQMRTFEGIFRVKFSVRVRRVQMRLEAQEETILGQMLSKK